MKKYGKLVPALIGAWFLFALFASAAHLFENQSNGVGLAVGLAALTPIAIFAVWYAASPNFRDFTSSLNPRTLTLAQTSRVLGITFVMLEARNLLPAAFALPAGYGDIAIGITAPFVAWKLANPSQRFSFVLWQILGMTDLVMAVTLGVTAGLLSAQGPTMGPMTVLPLSLIPTFVVPLLFIFHTIAIAQAKAWKSSTQAMKIAHPAEPNAAATQRL